MSRGSRLFVSESSLGKANDVATKVGRCGDVRPVGVMVTWALIGYMDGAVAKHPRKGERVVPDVMVWVTKPGDEDVQDLETLGEEVRGLDHVSEVDVRVEGSVVHVSFEGGKAEQEEIEDAIRQAGYEIFKVSHRER